jgi:hypothetical protein
VILEFILISAINYKELEYICVRWTWTGPVYDRKVTCIEWKKKGSKE